MQYFSLILAVQVALSSAFAPSVGGPRLRMAVSAEPTTLDGRVISSELQPVSNFVLVKLRDAMAQTAGGIIMPDQSKVRPNDGTVLGVGPGRMHPETGKLMPTVVEAGDNVMYGQYTGNKIKYNDEEHVIVREDEVLLRYKTPVITKESAEPIGDKILVAITSEEKVTSSGIVLSPEAAAKSRVCEGLILCTGPGRMSSEGEVIPMPVKAGDTIKFREFGAEEVNIEGEEYLVVRANDVLAKW